MRIPLLSVRPSSLASILKPSSGFPVAAIALNLVLASNSARAMMESSSISLFTLMPLA